METLVKILVCFVIGSIVIALECYLERRFAKKMLKKMVIIDHFETYFFDCEVLFTVRQYNGKYYLVITKEGCDPKIMGNWDYE